MSAMLLFWASLAGAATLDRVAAVVNDDVVALSEIYELGGSFIAERCPQALVGACVAEAELEVLDALIQRALIEQELKKLGLEVQAQDVDRAIDGMVRQYELADRDALRREVEAQGLGWEAYREQLQDQIRQMKFAENVLRPRITVSENEILDLYQRTVREYGTGSEARLEAFLLQVPDDASRAAVVAKARELADAVNAGTREWAATVREFDQGPYAARDGAMGTFQRGELSATLDAVVFATPEGRVATPVDVGGSVLVVRVAELRSSGVLPLEQVRDQLRNRLFEEKTEQAAEDWYAETRRKAAVRVLIGGSEAP